MKRSTTKPKGATSYKETAFGIIPRSTLLKLEIEGTKKGLEYLYSLVQKEPQNITPEFICTLHKVSFGWIFPNWAGKYRTIQVTYSGKEAPPYHQIPSLILNLCHDLAEQVKHLPSEKENIFISEVVRLLAWFQHRFVVIHPFKDYNGRIARMLTSYILLILSLPPIEIPVESARERKRYLSAMQDADNGNFSKLEAIIGSAITESVEKIKI